MIFCATFDIIKNMTTNKLDQNLPSGDYITGFVDGEGCFALTFRRDIRHERKGKPVYYSWKVLFAIVLRRDDYELLEKISLVLDCGAISFTEPRGNFDGGVRYQVSNIDDLKEKIIPFFCKYELHGKKKYDFNLWAKAVDILGKYKSKRGKVNIVKGKRGFTKVEWEEKDLQKLSEIKNEMSVYKSKKPVPKWFNELSKVGREL